MVMATHIDCPDVPDYSRLNEEQLKVQVGKTITGIIGCLKSGTPLDFSNFKAMHKDTPIFNIIHNKSKNDNETNFELYIKEVDKQLQTLELKLVPIYSAFENFGPTTEIWSFLEIYSIIFGQKIEIFEIAFPARSRARFIGQFLKISIFWPKIILKISKNGQISEQNQDI